jgi:hypothetical protein
MKCAIVESVTNTVVNLTIADPSWSPGDGLYLVPLNESEGCEIGQVYDEQSNPRFTGTPTHHVKVYTSYEFLLRFTAAERASFRAAAVTDSTVADFKELATAAQEIHTNDPMTIAGMNYLVSVGLLTEQRKLEIM